MWSIYWTFKHPRSLWQDLQEGAQRQLCLPEDVEDRFFEGPTCTSKIHGAFSAGGDELSGDEPRQFTNLENAIGCAVVDHGRLREA